MDPAHEDHSKSLSAVAAAWQALAPLMDLVTPMALRVAATLRLADEMPDQDNGAIPASELARRAGANADALTRLLRHLVQHGVFSEPQPGEFAVNQTAALLRADHPAAMRTWLDLDGFGGRMDLAFTGLAHTLRTGEPAWAQVFGQPFWQYLDANPEISTAFDQTMAGGASYWAAIADGFDWSATTHVVDVGGGTGALLGAVLIRNPGLRGTLLDLPETVARGAKYLTGLGLTDRFGVAGQSFFDPLPAGADAYLLSKIIHDWDDHDAATILRRCAQAADQHGRVLIIEGHGDTADAAFAEMNLRMLVLTGGRERTLDEYQDLAGTAGLRVVAVHQAADGPAIIECRAR
jgi:O-methyltransferase domain